MFNSKLYDVLKSIALIYLPGLTTLYFGIASIWGIPDTADVIGTMTVIDTFLGGLLGISTKMYQVPTDGAIVLDRTGAGTAIKIPLTQQEIASKGTITLQVQHDIGTPPS